MSICNFPYFLTDKQKTKKVREIQITQIFIVSITISNIFCALELEVKVKSYRCPKFGGDAKQTLEIRVEQKGN